MDRVGEVNVVVVEVFPSDARGRENCWRPAPDMPVDLLKGVGVEYILMKSYLSIFL